MADYPKRGYNVLYRNCQDYTSALASPIFGIALACDEPSFAEQRPVGRAAVFATASMAAWFLPPISALILGYPLPSVKDGTLCARMDPLPPSAAA